MISLYYNGVIYTRFLNLASVSAEFLTSLCAAVRALAGEAADGGGFETTDAKFWILSISQINGTQTNGVTENERLEWYQAGNDPAKILMNGSAIDMCWLRSIYSTDDTRNRVIPLTRPYTYSANPVPGVVPVCIIA